MTDQSETFDLKMLEDMIDATSSQESGCGITPYSSQNGVTHQCGQDHARVSRFPVLEDKKVKEMIATYGPNGSGSSRSADLQRSLESKLQARLPTGGLTMFIKGWNRKVTPLGRLYFQLAASVRPIGERDCGLWATPNTMDGMPARSKEAMDRQFNTTRKGRTAPANLREQVVPAMWPTVTTQDNDYCKSGDRKIMKLSGVAKEAALWYTPTTNPNDQPHDTKRGLSTLAGKVKETAALWPTTNASDHRDRGSYNDPCIQRRVKMGKQVNLSMIAQGTGKMESGSTAQTENKGSLNPQFPCWLMGIPSEWVSSIVRGMQSCRKSPLNLSAQICLEDMMT
jgi:hypothetical protein